MNELADLVEGLKKTEIKNKIDERSSEFKAFGKKGNNELFIELCFCLLTANYDAAKAITIQQKIGERFISLPETELSSELRRLGYRFPNVRAKFIVEAREYKESLRNIINSYKTDKSRRKWFAENVKGLGYKEASHFLRNIGRPDCAIIDFHIVDVLVRYRMIRKPKSLTKKVYLSIEKKLSVLAKKLDLSLAELDLYLWYLETGKILK